MEEVSEVVDLELLLVDLGLSLVDCLGCPNRLYLLEGALLLPWAALLGTGLLLFQGAGSFQCGALVDLTFGPSRLELPLW